jgi:short-subunit dehydrogenase
MSTAQVVMITGASAGVGRAVARRFARRGAVVGLLARGAAGLEAARREVEALGGRAVVCPADVADSAAVEAAAVHLEREAGPIDVWINNAMASVFSPIKQTPAEEFARVAQVTYLGVVHGTLAALRRMLPRNRGVIVQVGSTLAYRGIPLQAPYCAAKHAVQGFCDSLHSELRHDGSAVRLTMVQLPALNTPQFDWVRSRLPRRGQPVPPIYQPEVAARAIEWAAGHERREVLVGYPTVLTIIANMLAPGLVDRYLARFGYGAQQTEEPERPGRPDNLWDPVDDGRDFGAHGRFDRRARDWSWQLWLTEHRALVGGALTAAALTTSLAWARRRERR